MSSTLPTLSVSGNWDSNTLRPSGLTSELTWPPMGSNKASAETRRAPMPSNNPTVNTWTWSSISGRSPRTWQEDAWHPMGVNPLLTQKPPPYSEASEAVTAPFRGARRFICARGTNMMNRIISELAARGILRLMNGGSPLKETMNCHTEFKVPRSARLNIQQYTNPPQTICICRCVESPFCRRRKANSTYFRTLSGFGLTSPITPSTMAPCISALVDCCTDFFGCLGNPNCS